MFLFFCLSSRSHLWQRSGEAESRLHLNYWSFCCLATRSWLAFLFAFLMSISETLERARKYFSNNLRICGFNNLTIWKLNWIGTCWTCCSLLCCCLLSGTVKKDPLIVSPWDYFPSHFLCFYLFVNAIEKGTNSQSSTILAHSCLINNCLSEFIAHFALIGN